MEYKVTGSLQGSRRYLQILAFLFGVLMIAVNLKPFTLTGFLTGILLILVAFWKKESKFTEEGLVNIYGILFLRHKDVWKYEDITAIHWQEAENPEYFIFHVAKDILARRIFVRQEDAEAIGEMALGKNPEMFIGEVDQ